MRAICIHNVPRSHPLRFADPALTGRRRHVQSQEARSLDQARGSPAYNAQGGCSTQDQGRDNRAASLDGGTQASNAQDNRAQDNRTQDNRTQDNRA
jgi:hypothetical protein